MFELLNGLGGSELVYATARMATGTFFAISGWHKLTNKARHASLVATFKEDHIPLIRFNQWWVPSVEFFGGLAVAFGVLTPLAALGLIVVCCAACMVDAPKRVAAWHPIDKADKLDDWLYLPELIYVLLLALFAANGGGPVSLDAAITAFFA